MKKVISPAVAAAIIGLAVIILGGVFLWQQQSGGSRPPESMTNLVNGHKQVPQSLSTPVPSNKTVNIGTTGAQ